MGKKTSKTQKKTAAKPKGTSKPTKAPGAKASGAAARGKASTAKKESAKKVSTKKESTSKAAMPKESKISKKTATKPAAGSRRDAGESGAGSSPGQKRSSGAASKAPTSKSKKAGTPSAGAHATPTPPTPPTPATSTPAATAPAAKAPAAASAETSGADKKKVGPKGITIVQQKPSKPSKPKPKFQLPQGEPLLKPGAKWKPLIPSGPSAPPRGELGGGGPGDGTPIKTKLSKKELDRYRQVLLAKRAELVGDVRNMESEALLQNSGSLSHTPQHMAEQGTDVFDQSLNLDLAAVDRTLIREIDAALERIDAGTYGVCELSGKLISADRLDELPWTRYSIEAARERERRSYQP